MIESKILKKTGIVSHGFFNKKNGYSSGIYKSLNCSYGSNDNKKNVEKNLSYVKRKIFSEKNIVLLYQTHSSKSFFIKKFPKKKIQGDALITNVKGLPIAILTADCAPILILDYKKKIIAAIHAGWRGAYKNIITKVLKKLIRFGSNKKNIIVVVGPSIEQKSYEVGKEFRNKFLKKSKKNSIFFKLKKNRFHFDLAKYINYQLINFGISKIAQEIS